jgi:hypothetical protein
MLKMNKYRVGTIYGNPALHGDPLRGRELVAEQVERIYAAAEKNKYSETNPMQVIIIFKSKESRRDFCDTWNRKMDKDREIWFDCYMQKQKDISFTTSHTQAGKLQFLSGDSRYRLERSGNSLIL